MYCPKCAYKNPDDSIYCESCGYKLVKREPDKQQANSKKILIGLGILIVLLLILFTIFDKDKNSSTSYGKRIDGSKSEIQTEVINITAEDLASAYIVNEVQADITYKGKRVEITGKVYDIGFEDKVPYVVLSNETLSKMTDIKCFFKDDAEIAKFASLRTGHTVTMRGVVDGKSSSNNVSVNNCTFP